jgi:MOSC domain-containing protein YiiM
MRLELVSLNIGKPAVFVYEGRSVETGIFKNRTLGPVYLGAEQLDGDGQADMVHHGGADKAVCVYFAGHYPYWEKELNRKLEWGAFGENFTVAGASEADLCIGDLFQIGEAVVQISQPRQPCHKLAKKHDVKELALSVQQTGFTGYYFRVIKEGHVQAGQSLELLEKHPAAVSLAYANSVMYADQPDKQALQALASMDVLSASWRKTFTSRLAGLESR